MAEVCVSWVLKVAAPADEHKETKLGQLRYAYTSVTDAQQTQHLLQTLLPYLHVSVHVSSDPSPSPPGGPT